MIQIYPWKFIRSIFREIYYAVIHFFLPHFCLICGTIHIEANEIICDKCWNKLPSAPSNEKILDELQNKLSGQCYFSNVSSLWQFCPEAQTIIHYLKYKTFGNLAKRIGKTMAEKLAENQLHIQNTILIQIPLHKTRIRERGYNQSSLLCKTIASETGVKFENNVLKRIRYTASQTKLSAKQRQKNVAKAFSVSHQEKIINKKVILVDDVITTGATMNGCARVLVKNGAKEVNILSAVKA